MKKIVLAAMLTIAAALMWRARHASDGETADRGQRVLYDRTWVDHLPRSETESMQVFLALTREPVGMFLRSSQWQGEYELFRHEPRGDGQLELLFPQTRERQRVTYRAWKCNVPDFDFCLEISGSRGARKYFSQRGWEVKSLDEARGFVARLRGR